MSKFRVGERVMPHPSHWFDRVPRVGTVVEITDSGLSSEPIDVRVLIDGYHDASWFLEKDLIEVVSQQLARRGRDRKTEESRGHESAA